MAITKSGLYFLTEEKMRINTTAINIETELTKVALVTDTEAPNFETHDFYADLAAEIVGTGYTAGGELLTGTEVTLASNVLRYDAADTATWTTSTITDAMAAVGHIDDVTNELHFLSDFVTAASSSGGTFTIEWSATGIYTIDFAP